MAPERVGRRLAAALVATAAVVTVATVLIVFKVRDVSGATAGANDAVEYEALTTVLEDNSHGPMLCLSGALMSLPPQCGDVPISNWDWSQAPNQQSQSGARWSDGIVVTGTFNGKIFTQTRPPRAPSDDDRARLTDSWPAPTPDFTAPCPPPPGGWLAEAAKVPDGTDFNTVMQTFGAYVTSQPDFASWWPDQSINMNYSTGPINATQAGTMNDPQQLIMVAAFTGSLDRHRAELRKIWPGALCVTTAPRSNADRDTIDHAVHQMFASGELGTTSLLGTTASLLGDVVLAHVTVITPELQTTLDQRFGRGAVELNGVLRSIPTAEQNRHGTQSSPTLQPTPMRRYGPVGSSSESGVLRRAFCASNTTRDP